MGDPFLTGSDLKCCFKNFDGESRIAVAEYAKNAELYEILDIKCPVQERRVRNVRQKDRQFIPAWGGSVISGAKVWVIQAHPRPGLCKQDR